jgi:CDP-glycerol glycerophosphotransferase (TagB/SpsB family)
VLYAPTGARANSLETFGEELVERLAAADSYDVIVKPHDHPKAAIDWYERLAPLESEHLRLLRTPDAIPTLYVSDLLISDASSIANEYLLLDRPIVFLDVPELLAAAAGEDDRLDLDTWGRSSGTVVSNADAALDAVANGLARPLAQCVNRRAMARDLFYNAGTATEAALQWIRTEGRVVA